MLNSCLIYRVINPILRSSSSLSWRQARSINQMYTQSQERKEIYIFQKKVCFTLWEHLSSPPVFSDVRVTRCFVDRCLSFCSVSVSHCVVCPSIYGFRLPLRIYHVISEHKTINISTCHKKNLKFILIFTRLCIKTS